MKVGTDPTERVLYDWGWRAWYHRLIALTVYATGLLLMGFFFPARNLLLQPDIGNLVLLAILVVLVTAWILVIRITWRDGQARVSRITLLPEKEALLVRTLNFGSRLIPLAALVKFHFADLKPDMTEYREPILTVVVRDGTKLRIDLEGRILDEEVFNTIFRYRRTKPRAGK